MEASSLSPIASHAEPVLFKHEDDDKMRLWVHPETVGRMELVRTIEVSCDHLSSVILNTHIDDQENGGSAVETPGVANFAIVGKDISNEQLKFLAMEQLGTVVLSADWIQDSASRGEIQQYLKYVLLMSEEDFDEYYNMLANNANESREGTQGIAEGLDDAQNKDGRFFLDAAKNLLSQDHSRPLEDVYHFCASQASSQVITITLYVGE